MFRFGKYKCLDGHFACIFAQINDNRMQTSFISHAMKGLPMHRKPAHRFGIALLLLMNVMGGWVGSAKAEEISHAFRYDQLPSLQGLIPRTSEYYTIHSDVRTEGVYYRFTVTSDHGEYTVVGINRLIEVTHEIVRIELFRKTEHGNEAWNGAKESLGDVGRGAKQIVLHPGDSGRAIGRKVKKTGRSVGRFFRDRFSSRDDEPESSTGEERDRGVGGFFSSEHARRFAYENDLDIYSTNPYVRALIEEVSRSRWRGALGVSTALFFVSPIPGLSAVTTGALTGSDRDEEMEQLIRDNDPAELRRALRIQYHEAFDEQRNTPEDGVLMRLLSNPNYSPREVAYLVSYMRRMREVAGRTALLGMLADIDTVADAMFATQQMQLLAAVHAGGRPLASYAVGDGHLGAFLAEGDALTILPIDFADATPQTLEGLEGIARGRERRSTNLWIIGDATPAFRAAMQARGIHLQEAILRYPAFREADK